MKNLNQTSFTNRAVKTFSVAAHLFRGIITFTRKSLRWGTSDSMKISTRDNVAGKILDKAIPDNWTGLKIANRGLGVHS